MHNLEIRERIKSAGVFGYEVAAACGVSETSFSRMMARTELPPEKKTAILAAIERLSNERQVRA